MVNGILKRVGVVADTHVPDRIDCLHPHLLDELRRQGVELILHAGDISTPCVVEELTSVAPVHAAFGNRDFAFNGSLPWVNQLEIAGSRVALMHGHGSWWNYFWDKWVYVAKGYQLERYQRLALKAAQDARVVVFGHTHHAEAVWVGEQLLFNPGSASHGFRRHMPPTYGVLDFGADGSVENQIVVLQGYRWDKRGWLKTS